MKVAPQRMAVFVAALVASASLVAAPPAHARRKAPARSPAARASAAAPAPASRATASPGAAKTDTAPTARCGFFYGTYSVGPKDGTEKMPLDERIRQIRALGANMVVATGDKTKVLDALPEGMLGVPGCSLMKKRDWQRDGHWDEGVARERLAKLAAKFGDHPRVYGVCLTHEVTEYADHARRVWMYRLAKEYFPRKKVIQYYGTVYDRLGAAGEKQYSYGENGEIETDVFFVSLPAADHDGHPAPDKAKRLDVILESAARTPDVPVWGQTSINADHKYVKGPDTMYAIWGQHGENMAPWVTSLLRKTRLDARGRHIRLSGFFWRSLGRFPYDLGYPPFDAHRAQVRAIAESICDRRATGD